MSLSQREVSAHELRELPALEEEVNSVMAAQEQAVDLLSVGTLRTACKEKGVSTALPVEVGTDRDVQDAAQPLDDVSMPVVSGTAAELP